MKLTIALAVTAVSLTLVAPAGAVTKDQAFGRAKACLMQLPGHRQVLRRADGGGFATFTNASLMWTYTDAAPVRVATVRPLGSMASAAYKARLVRCVALSVR